MTYRQSLEFLYRRGNEVQGIHLGLHRVETILDALGSPHLKVPALHIAGTNGKGSVAATAESILRHCGWRTGLYTSPHLEKIEERIRVDGREISPRRFASLVSRVREVESDLHGSGRLDIPLTFFEFLTTCSFLHFANQELDVVVIEVGLGGRLDATNVVLPNACVITGISLDHTNLLGKTIGAIAREKAGIIKNGVPVISGCRPPEARRVIAAQARRLGAPLLEIDDHCTTRVLGERGARTEFDLRTPLAVYPRLRSALAGRQQTRNATLAIAAVEAAGFRPMRPGDVRRALLLTRWPGRLDEYRAARRTLLDGAHNPEAARLLRDHLREAAPAELHFVFGAMKDKDHEAMGRVLFPLARSIHLTQVSNLRSASPEILAAPHPLIRSRMRFHSSAAEALHAAWGECSRRGMVVVTGSLYLVGEVISLVRRSVRSSRD